MSHTQTIPSDTRVWDHLRFFGRRNATNERHLGFIYGRFASQDDADSYPNAQPELTSGDFGAKGALLDEYMLSADGYAMTDARVFALLQRLLSGNFTQAEFEQTYGLETARKRMAGVEFKVGGVTAFTVSELPAERLA